MTVEYDSDNGFLPLLFRWQGSVWKAVIWQLLVFLCIYAVLTTVFHFALDVEQQAAVIRVAQYFRGARKTVPITILLGFFVNRMIKRWWEQFRGVIWVDQLSFAVAVALNKEGDEEQLIARRNVCRWMNLTGILCWRSISSRVRKRYPTLDQMVETGLLLDSERKHLQDVGKEIQESGSKSSIEIDALLYWVPMFWVSEMCGNFHDRGIIDEFHLDSINREAEFMRDCCEQLMNYNWVNVPLAYTQVAILGTYGYFLTVLLGSQPSDSFSIFDGKPFDLYIPLITILEFCFYIGWLSVAADVCWPFGEDDEDYELGFTVDKNVQMGLLYAEMKYPPEPTAAEDKFWSQKYPRMPRSVASKTSTFDNPRKFKLPEPEDKDKENIDKLWIDPKRHNVRRVYIPDVEEKKIL